MPISAPIICQSISVKHPHRALDFLTRLVGTLDPFERQREEAAEQKLSKTNAKKPTAAPKKGVDGEGAVKGVAKTSGLTLLSVFGITHAQLGVKSVSMLEVRF